MTRINKKPDIFLLGVSAVLVVLGILILASVSASYSEEKFGTTYYFLKHQVVWGLLPGLILGFLAFRIKLEFIKKWIPLALLGNLILMGMVFLPKIGSTYGGASRWIHLGFISLQPAEFLKLTFILYLALWLANRTSRQKPEGKKSLYKTDKYDVGLIENKLSKTFFSFLVVMGLISFFLILQPDISTLGVILIIAALMYFIAGTPLWHCLVIIVGGAIGLLGIVKLAPYRLNRILVFLDPQKDPMGIGYHIKQAMIAVGSGGIFGKGLGMSHQKFGFLPESISDSIFAIFAEETGFVGALILIILFSLFLWRGIYIIKNSPDRFQKFSAVGITVWITFQAFANIGAMIRILPLGGIPLTFISYGGSALIAELIGVGILLNISKNVKA